MPNLIGFPFNISTAGYVISLPDDSDEYYAGELASMCMTELGERELVPGFGISDPSFAEFDDVEFAATVMLYGPPVQINDVIFDYIDNEQQIIEIEFESVNEFFDAPFTTNDDDDTYTEGLG